MILPPARQRQRHPGGTVAQEHAHLERLLRARQARQQLQKLALLGRGLHGGLRMLVGSFALLAQHLGFAQRDLADVVRHFIGDGSVNT